MTKYSRKVVWRLVTFILLGNVFAQEPTLRFNNMTIENGLSQNTVTNILQDKQGYMWFATRDGLNKYDGYDFKVFRPSSGRTLSPSNNNVQCIFQDSNGNLWIGTAGGGLTRFDPETETFKNYFHDSYDRSTISSNHISAIAEDSTGNLWLGTADGLNYLNPVNDSIYVYRSDPGSMESLSGDFINDILFDKNGLLWIGTENNGACIFNPQTQTFRQFLHDTSNSQSIASDRIQEIHQDRQDRIWFATKQGLSLYQPETGQFINTQIADDVDGREIVTIEEDQFGNLWLGTARSGLFRRDEITGQITRYSSNHINPRGLPDSGILDLFRDRENNIWGGLNGLGIFRFDPNPVFRLYTDLEETKSLSNSSVRAIYASADSNLWIGTYGGLDYFDKKTGNHQLFQAGEIGKDLPSNNVYTILPDGKTNLWIGMEGQGLVYYDRAQNMFTTYIHEKTNKNSIPNDFIFSMARDEQGRLWIGTGDGLAKIERSKDKTLTSTNYFTKDRQETGIIRSLEVTKEINLWIGTENKGLFYFNSTTGTYSVFTHDPENPNSINSDAILSLYEESDTSLWVGTHGGGLNRFNQKTNIFDHFTVADGLANNIIYGILPDDQGNLWLSTNNGVSYFDQKHHTFNNYDVHDGLQSNEFNRGAHFQSESGDLYFGGIKGMNVFNPEDVLLKRRIPTAIITDFQLFNESIPINLQTGLEKHVSYLKEIEIKHTDRVISFEFSGLYYSGPEQVTYAYKLDGVNTDWVIAPASKRFVTYTNLPAGEYNFYVQAFVDQNHRNNETAMLTLHMRPAPWKTPLAYISYLGFGLILLYLFRAYELKQILLRNQLKEERFDAKRRQEMDQIKSEFFANISHEFRTPLTLIKGRLHDIQKVLSSTQRKNLHKHFDVSNRNIDRLEDLMNQILDLSKLDAGTVKLNTKLDDFSSFLKRIESTFQILINQRGLTFTLNLPKHPVYLYYDEIKMERVFNNLIANAIEFTPKDCSIQCTLSENGDEKGIGSFVSIEIADTGAGIPEEAIPQIFDRFYQADTSVTRSHEGTGIGLALVKELIELHGGSITVISEVNVGTTFTIQLPKGSDHLLDSEIKEVGVRLTEEADSTIIGKAELDDPAKLKILVVEDNRDMSDFICDQLREDYNISCAFNGLEGLKTASDQLPDLIISDVMMPVMDGYTFVKKIRNHEALSHVPIILLTAKSSKEDRIAGHETLADAYITKPFNADELVAQIGNLLESRRRLYRKFSETWMYKQEQPALDGPDKEFMDRVIESIETNLSNAGYSVDGLARATFLSRRQLERRLRDLAGITPGEIIRKTRLLKAKQLLEINKTLTVSEAANQVGFSNVKYFSRLFQHEFDITPRGTLKS